MMESNSNTIFGKTMRNGAHDRDKARNEFSQRLNTLLDHYGVVGKHAGRQVEIAKIFGVSQEATRKWLEGEAIPKVDKIGQICREYPCRQSWLQSGEEPMFIDEGVKELLDFWENASPEKQSAILAVIRNFGH